MPQIHFQVRHLRNGFELLELETDGDELVRVTSCAIDTATAREVLGDGAAFVGPHVEHIRLFVASA